MLKPGQLVKFNAALNTLPIWKSSKSMVEIGEICPGDMFMVMCDESVAHGVANLKVFCKGNIGVIAFYETLYAQDVFKVIVE